MKPRTNLFTIAICSVMAPSLLSSCVSSSSKQLPPGYADKMAQVRFISETKAGECTYVNQTSITQNNSLLGTQTTEQEAQKRLRDLAASVDANSVHITQRLLDKGRGGYDKTRLSLYADLYRC